MDISTQAKPLGDSKPASYGWFNGVLALSVALPLLGSLVFNVMADPYGVYAIAPVQPGFNQAKPAKKNNVRLFKALEVIRQRPVTVFLGSSRTEYGLDPAHPVFADHQPAYNLGLSAGTPYELRRYLEHALANQQLEQVVINVDEFMFNALNVENPTFVDQRLERRRLRLVDWVNTTLSLSALAASWENLKYSAEHPDYQTYQPDGQLNLRPIDQQPEKTDYRFRQSIGFYFEAFPVPYELSQQYLDEFQKIVELCQRHGVPFKVFISPSHVTRWEAIRAAGHWPMYEQMKRELVKITPVWDFSGYNSVTTEPLQPEMTGYLDDSHYTETVGDLVLSRLYDDDSEAVPEDFGVLLTPDSIEAHLAQINAEREAWAKENPETVALVEELHQNSLSSD